MTRDEIVAMWEQAANDSVGLLHTEFLEKFAALVAAAEREACAQSLERIGESDAGQYLVGKDQAKLCAAAIRARGGN